MTDQEIIAKTQDWFDCAGPFGNNSVTQDDFNSPLAFRLINSYLRYISSESGRCDFECALRNYLISFNTDISVPGYIPSESNRFGLMLNRNTGRIYANYAFPCYINSKFANEVFNGTSADSNDNDKSIRAVNPYINNLTGHRFGSFKSVSQQLVVTGALKTPNGYTAMIAMSTGGGKSLVTQSVSYQYKNSLTIIIVPTISLMLDQCRNARDIISSAAPNEIACYYSGCDREELINALKHRDIRMLFISPETLIKNNSIRSALLEAASSGYLRNMIIDEAHIIIEWGSSFRLDFQCLDSFRKLLISENPDLRTFLLSATYSKKTVDNLKKFYSDSGRWIEIRLDTLRKEPRFDIIKCSSYTDKHNKLKELVCTLPRPMIVYVNTPDDAEKIQIELFEYGFKNTRIFTGRTGSAERERLINEWVEDQFDLMIATCAFGVGVDKHDVRTVIHAYVPSGPDQYYQECGRGGRDGKPCLSVMLFTKDDINAAVSMSQKVLTVEKLSGRWFSMLSSYKSSKKLDRIIIDTSVKPDYNESDSFFAEASNADITWNVYVILMLRRAGLLNIAGVEYIDDRYIFTVNILEQRILFKNDESDSIFEKIRENESKSIYSEVAELTKKLNRVSKECWSDMFNDIYLLTDEYCAGCNHHDNIRSGRVKFPLKKSIPYPLSQVSDKLSKVMCGMREMMIISENSFCGIIKDLANSGANVIVLPKYQKDVSFLMDSDMALPGLMIIDYDEFFDLCSSNNYFYLSGCIVFFIGSDAELASRTFDANANNDCCKIYITESDIYIPGKFKNISELVNGPCKFDYIIEKELM